jgi:hypothetical protein
LKWAWFGYIKILDQFFEPFPNIAFALTAPKPLEKQSFLQIHKEELVAELNAIGKIDS